MAELLKSFVLAFSALLPLINPLGSALLFLGIVGAVPTDEFRDLARKVAIRTVLFLLVIELIGAALLNFFGLSLPVVQFSGGLVVAAMGWRLLNSETATQNNHQASVGEGAAGELDDKIFYPLTFPLTAGPGCIVVTVTLSAHSSQEDLARSVFAHLGIALAVIVLGVSVWLCYAYAPRITQKISSQTVNGILRVIAFVLLCIGVQIAWKGLAELVTTIHR